MRVTFVFCFHGAKTFLCFSHSNRHCILESIFVLIVHGYILFRGTFTLPSTESTQTIHTMYVCVMRTPTKTGRETWHCSVNRCRFLAFWMMTVMVSIFSKSMRWSWSQTLHHILQNHHPNHHGQGVERLVLDFRHVMFSLRDKYFYTLFSHCFLN